MLQIIGWLGCLYLFVKGCEALANSSYRTADGGLNGYANTAVVLSFAGALGFALWLLVQGGALKGLGSSSLAAVDYNVDANLPAIDDTLNADMNAQ